MVTSPPMIILNTLRLKIAKMHLSLHHVLKIKGPISQKSYLETLIDLTSIFKSQDHGKQRPIRTDEGMYDP